MKRKVDAAYATIVCTTRGPEKGQEENKQEINRVAVR